MTTSIWAWLTAADSWRGPDGIPTRLQFYTIEELDLIVARGARLMGIKADPQGTREIARRARGTPRIANRLLRRVRDAIVDGTLARLECAS